MKSICEMLSIHFLVISLRNLVWILHLQHSQFGPTVLQNLIDICGCMHAQSLQPCPILYDTVDHSLPGSSVRGISQAGILEWVAMPSSWGWIFLTQGSNPCLLYLLYWQAGSVPLGKWKRHCICAVKYFERERLIL